MTQYFGYNTRLWFKESPTFNATDVMDAGTTYGLWVKPGVSLKQIKERIETQNIRGTRFLQSPEIQHGISSCAGSIPGNVAYASAFSFLMKHLLGKVVTTGPVSLIYTHTFTWNQLVFTGLSFAHNKIGATWNYHGCQINSIKLSTAVGNYLSFDFGILGCRESVVAQLTPTAPSDLLASQPYIKFDHIVVELAGTPFAFASLDLEINNGIDSSPDKAYQLGSAVPANLVPVGGGITGTFRRRVQKDGDISQGTFFSEHASSLAYKAVEITCTNPVLTDYTMVITFDAIFEQPEIKPDDQGIIMEEVSFRDVNLATASIVITDNFSGPVTATGAYNG